MTLYVQALAKRKEADDRDKLLPVGYLGSTMIGHGQDFQLDSEFGSCLISMFRNRRVFGWQDADRIQVLAVQTSQSHGSKRHMSPTLLPPGLNQLNGHWYR